MPYFHFLEKRKLSLKELVKSFIKNKQLEFWSIHFLLYVLFLSTVIFSSSIPFTWIFLFLLPLCYNMDLQHANQEVVSWVSYKNVQRNININWKGYLVTLAQSKWTKILLHSIQLCLHPIHWMRQVFETQRMDNTHTNTGTHTYTPLGLNNPEVTNPVQWVLQRTWTAKLTVLMHPL